MTLVSLVHAASSMNSIINFIEGASFLEALSVIGDNELKAAKQAMQNVGKAQDKKRDVTLAVGHLQSAHTAYRSIWQQTLASFTGNTKLVTLGLAVDKDRYVSCLMALCYVYLGEFQLAQDYVAFAKEALQALQLVADRQTDGEFATTFIVSMLREPIKLIRGAKEKIPSADMKAFSEAIEQYR